MVNYYEVHYTSNGAVAANAVLRNDGNAALGWVPASRRHTGTSISITGLNGGTAYRVRVQGVISDLIAQRSAFVVATGTPLAAPGVPRNVQVVPGDARLTVSWQAPSSWGSWNAASYDVEEDTGGQFHSVRDNSVVATFSASDTSFVVTGFQANGDTVLTNGETVKIRIRAVSVDPDSAGNQLSHFLFSPWVTVTATVGGLAAPTGLTVTPGNAKLDLSWTAPSGTVTGYDVHYTSAAAGTADNDAAVQTGGSATAATGWLAVTRSGTTAAQTISSLANGTAYRVRVRAKNADGNGVWLFGTGTPQLPPAPAAPTNLIVTPGDTVMSVSWTAPPGPVSGYDLHYTTVVETTVANNASVVSGDDPSTGWVNAGNNPTATSQYFVALTNGIAHRVRVRAKNAGGNSAWVFGTGTPGTGLLAPTNLVVAPSNTQLSLSWTAPTGTLTGYDVHYTSAVAGTVGNDAAASGSDASAAWVAVSRTEAAPPTASQRISSLSNGTAYRVRVRAKSADGNSAWVFGSGTPSNLPTVSLSVFPTTVAEGGLVSVIATLSAAPSQSVTIPITVTLDSAEAGDFSAGTLAGLRAGFAFPTNQKQKVFNLGTTQDTDTQDEKFTVALGTLPTGYAAGAVTSVTVTIEDDETKPTVSALRAIPSPPKEGESFSIGVTLSALPAVAVNIPLTVTLGTAEPEDFDATELDYLRSNGIPLTTTGGLGQTSGPLLLNTDLDREDETFTVAIDPDGLAELGLAMAPGAATSVEVTIKDLPWLVLKINDGDRKLLIGPLGELGPPDDPRARWVEVSPTTKSVTLTVTWLNAAIGGAPTAQVRYVMHGIDGDTLTWEADEKNTSKTLELYSPLGSPGYPRLTLSAGNGLDYTIYFHNNSRWEFHQDTLLKILEMRTQ